MTDLHALRVLAGSAEEIEAQDPNFVRAGLEYARMRTIEVLDEVRARIAPGQTEDEARRLTLEIFREHGVTKHWHKPYVRFGAGTKLTFNDPLQADYRLREGDPFYLDLGPVWKFEESRLEYEGDYGDTFVLGENPGAEKCASTARALFAEAKAEWQRGKLTGEAIYGFLRQRARETGYVLVDQVDGHRIGDFPHHRYTKAGLAHQAFVPSESRWVLEIQLNHPSEPWGAFFEDVL